MSQIDNFNCVFCKQKTYGYGNNPEPLKKKGRCCNQCNSEKVIPARLKQIYNRR